MTDLIPIPLTLRGQHSAVRATQTAVGRAPRREDGRLDVGRRPGVCHLLVSRDQVRPALLLLQAVFTEAERRGYAIVPFDHQSYGPPAGVALQIRGHEYPIEVTELTDRVPLTAGELEAWRREEAKRHRFSWEREREPPSGRNVPNGYLRISLAHRRDGRRSNWSGGPRGGLERKLPDFFTELERRADDDDKRDAERRRRAEEWRRQELERLERQRLAQVERARATRLFEEIAAWRRAQEVDEYVAALRARLSDLDPAARTRLAAWCDWAENWAQRTDPVQNAGAVRGLSDP